MPQSGFDNPDDVTFWIVQSFHMLAAYVAIKDRALALEALSAAAKVIDARTAAAPLSEGDRDGVLDVFQQIAEALDKGDGVAR
jgi:hypothetical protein